MPGKYTTNFKDENGNDLGSVTVGWIEKDYYLDVYSGLIPNLKTPGLWTWGADGYGQLGDNAVNKQSSPVQTVAGGTNWKQISNGQHFTSAIKTDGTLWTWGRNHHGQLGINDATDRSSPVQTVAGGTNWKSVASGSMNFGSIKTDGTLWLCGYNAYGQLGDNSAADKSSPVQTVAGGSTWKSVACGERHTVTIKTDGTLWIWGYNLNGQLGTNDTINKSSPVQTVSGGSNWREIDANLYHTLAIKTDGTLWTWGENSNGQLGDNTIVNKSSPIQTVTGGTNWKQVATTLWGSAAIKTDGTLWLWGYNATGRIGDNSAENKSSPVQTVTGGTAWKLVGKSTGFFTVAIKTDGTLWVWGQNNLGQLGDNSVANKSSPIQTISGGTTWKSVSSGTQHTAAIQDFDL